MARKVFISYHHEKDQWYANELQDFHGAENVFIDRSLPEAFDSDDDDYILGQIRTKHLRDSTVTIVLIGSETWTRKWVDWEIYSSLRPYGERTVNGLLGILLPNASRLPERFDANYKTGYAKLVRWDDVAPPRFWRADQTVAGSLYAEIRRAKLADWIEKAFANRTRTDLIDNSLPRMKRNKTPNSPWWW